MRRATPEAGQRERWVGILAAPLDAPGLLEREVIELLGRTGLALVDSCEGLRDWVPRGSDPTVRVRPPPNHPGLPMGFTPFLLDTPAALAAVTTGDLFERALAGPYRFVFGWAADHGEGVAPKRLVWIGDSTVSSSAH